MIYMLYTVQCLNWCKSVKVENEFIGVNSGIMDQFAVGMGEKDQAILLDTNNMHYEMVPAKLGGIRLSL